MTRSIDWWMRVALLVLLAPGRVHADVRLPSIIGDGMVLQRETDVTIWGWARPGEKVRVEPAWSDTAANTRADEHGHWAVALATPAAGGPYDIAITAASRHVLRDVLIGEVWLCSGQSNMEWPISRTQDAQREIAAAEHPRIRLFTVPNVPSLHPRRDCRGSWSACSPRTAAGFSAVGYFFGRELQQALDVPVGLISADWGGTIIEAWMSPETLAAFPEHAETLEMIEAMRDPNQRGPLLENLEQRWWESLAAEASWRDLDLDDSGWPTMPVPAAWDADGLGDFDGIVRLRYGFEAPHNWEEAAAVIDLGPIDDYDDVWLNGVHVGATHAPGRWAAPRRYAVPAGVLRAGPNVLAVRVLDTGGQGGINGVPEQMRIRPDDAPESAAIRLAGVWRYQRGRSVDDLPKRPQGMNVGRNTPTALYGGMIAPIEPFKIRGALWYQGESNVGRSVMYARLFPAMIEQWRDDRDDDFPFLFVQIAPWDYGDRGDSAALRDAQRRALAVRNTGMVVTTDIGDAKDIHPRNKQEVGRRLALWALAKTYGGDVACSGPLYRSMTVETGSIRIAFDHAENGLVGRGGAVTHFQIAGADRRFHDAAARIDGSTIVVSSPDVTEPVAVRFAWDDIAEPNLFNRAGLPASPFRTDDWPIEE